MKKWWIALCIIGVILFFGFTYAVGQEYHQQMLKASEDETVSYGSIFTLVIYLWVAIISLGLAIFGGYKACKAN
jgi:hypothetical protein